MDCIERLITYYNAGSEQNVFREVVEHILRNLHKIENATIYDLAEMCYASPSTISRLVKKLEFKDYGDFKSQMSYALKNYRYLNRNTESVPIVEDQDCMYLYFDCLMKHIEHLREDMKYEDIRKISDAFFEADKVLFYSAPAVDENRLQKSLLVSGKMTYLYNTLQLQKESLNRPMKDTVIFAIVPDLLEMAPMLSILTAAKQAGAKLITLCSAKQNYYTTISDIQIAFDGTKTSMDTYLFRIIVNIIQYDYENRYLNQVIDKLYE